MIARTPEGISAPGWESARRVLCIRLDSLGDVLMTTPAIRAIREALPVREITLVTSPSGAQVAPLVPEVDEAIVYEAPWVKAGPDGTGVPERTGGPNGAGVPERTGGPDGAGVPERTGEQERWSSRADLEMIRNLREGGFDAAVIFTVFSQNPLPAALMVYLAEIPLRAAYSRENPYQLLTHYLPDPYPREASEIPHEVERHLALAAGLGCPAGDTRLSLRVPGGAVEAAAGMLAGAGVRPDAPWVVVHPGATAPSRRYPPELFARAVRALVEEAGVQVVLSGTAGEKPLAEEIRRMSGATMVNFAGCLDLAVFSGLLKLAPLLISNNSGPVHIAAAVGTPVVDLYALTNPQHTPWGVPNRVLNHDVPCRWCYKSVCPQGHQNCLRLVAPEAVVRAALELLAGSTT